MVMASILVGCDKLLHTTTDCNYEYVPDPKYVGEPSASLPCYSKGGKSYTPPGWMRKYKRRPKPAASKAAKRIKYDN
jgi:isocitrate dehydrogenase kinase/phosphatase